MTWKKPAKGFFVPILTGIVDFGIRGERGEGREEEERIAAVAYGVAVAVPGRKSSVGMGGGTISNPFLSVNVK